MVTTVKRKNQVNQVNEVKQKHERTYWSRISGITYAPEEMEAFEVQNDLQLGALRMIQVNLRLLAEYTPREQKDLFSRFLLMRNYKGDGKGDR